MTACILEGKTLAQNIKNQLKERVKAMAAIGQRVPGLAVILVGEDAASSVYVKNKKEACLSIGFESHAYHLPSETTTATLLSLIQSLNLNSKIDGILVQLPLPAHINTHLILESIDPKKDVDGFHPFNQGLLLQNRPTLRPCTPYGIMQLLNYYQIEVTGKDALVIGASNIVGRPMGLELLNAKATPMICHRQSQHLEQHVNAAELIIVATGTMDVIKPQWLNENHILIDVGIHRLNNNQLRGDIHFEEAVKIVKAITPVPGGVGPLTVASLLQNTYMAWKN